jgi:hypothetical protein
MAEQEVSRQNPAPTSGPEGSDLRSVANTIEGLLDDDGQFNPTPGQLSRGHPDYNPDTDPRNKPGDRDDRGRFKPKATEDQGDEPAPEPAEEDQPTGDDQTEDAETEPGDTDEDQTTPAVEDAETEPAETDAIQTLEQLASALEVPLSELKSEITHSFRAADEDVTVTLAELEAGYQKDADYRRNTGKLAEDRRRAEQDYKLNMQQFEQQHSFLAQGMGVTEQLLAQELNDPRLASLRESDPAEWTARREEIGQRVGALRQARQQAAQQYDQFRNQQRGELKQREETALKERMPDFNTTHVQLARQAMGSLGYGNEEISEIFDHRLVMGALELAALRSEVQTLRAEKSKARDTVKRVKKDVPKLTKPGKQQLRGTKGIKRDNVSRLKERAKKSGSVDDAARVIEQMIF